MIGINGIDENEGVCVSLLPVVISVLLRVQIQNHRNIRNDTEILERKVPINKTIDHKVSENIYTIPPCKNSIRYHSLISLVNSSMVSTFLTLSPRRGYKIRSFTLVFFGLRLQALRCYFRFPLFEFSI